jgi:hypothetical protein
VERDDKEVERDEKEVERDEKEAEEMVSQGLLHQKALQMLAKHGRLLIPQGAAVSFSGLGESNGDESSEGRGCRLMHVASDDCGCRVLYIGGAVIDMDDEAMALALEKGEEYDMVAKALTRDKWSHPLVGMAACRQRQVGIEEDVQRMQEAVAEKKEDWVKLESSFVLQRNDAKRRRVKVDRLLQSASRGDMKTYLEDQLERERLDYRDALRMRRLVVDMRLDRDVMLLRLRDLEKSVLDSKNYLKDMDRATGRFASDVSELRYLNWDAMHFPRDELVEKCMAKRNKAKRKLAKEEHLLEVESFERTGYKRRRE